MRRFVEIWNKIEVRYDEMATEERVTYLEYIFGFFSSASQRILGIKKEEIAENTENEENEVDSPKEESLPLEHTWSERPIKIGSVLENDFYLAEVLKHLVEDSIPECLRVCKRWHKACKALPIKTRRALSPNSLPALFQVFPNVETLKLIIDCTRDVDDLLSSINSFQKLKALSLIIGTTGKNMEWLEENDSAIARIPCLGIRFAWHDPPLSYPPFRFLTNLTSLEIDRTNPEIMKDQEPFVTLPKMEELVARPSVFWNDEGQLMFPSLTQLTHLDLTDSYQCSITTNMLRVTSQLDLVP